MDFKVKCIRVKKYPDYFTEGKIYEVKDKKVVCDNGFVGDAWAYSFNGNADFEAFSKWWGEWFDFELVEDKKMFTTKDLKTGMFGYFDNETDDWFVIVGDRFVYQKGLGDNVCMLNDDLESPSGRKITALYHAKCFDHAAQRKGKLIWKREEKKPELKLYNGKVVCVEVNNNPNLYTVGKIYQFKDGNLIADNGGAYPGTIYTQIHTFKDWAKWTSSKFIEIKE